MIIAIISDTHDNLANLEKTLQWVNDQKIKTIIHCGDLCNLETLQFIQKNFKGDFYMAFGNGDYERGEMMEYAENFKNISLFEEYGEAKIDKQRIAFTHFPNFAKPLAESSGYNIVYHGHSHKPWEEKIGKTILLNPGNIAGIRYKATFATLDTKTLKHSLHLIEKL